MQQTKTCIFINRYSEIEGFQERKTVTYSAKALPNGVHLSIKQKNESDTYSEACICSSASFEKAASFLKYISENSIGIGSWYDVLRDMGVKFTIV